MTPMLFCVAMAAASAASAQPRNSGGITVSGGIRWIGPMSIADVSASETTAGGGTRTLFESKTTLNGSVGASVAAGVRVSSVLHVEGGASFNPTRLSTRVTNDVEGATDVTASERVAQLVAEVGVLMAPRQRRTVSRLSPFAIAGLGYVRHLNEGRTLVETGRELYAGAGLYYERASARSGRSKSTGLRLDARAIVLHGAVAPDAGSHVAAAITAAVFVRF
jgi:opacity protein-like surface antigen